MKQEERKAEELRQEIIFCVENDLHRLSLEARSPYVYIELIEELRAHALLKNVNHENRASVRGIVHYSDLRG